LRYRRAFLGWLWAVGQPLARLLVLSIVFTKFVPLGIPNYAEFLFCGLISWIWFAAGVSSATTSALDRRDLLFKVGVPRTAVPAVSVLTDGLDYLAAMPVLAVFLIAGDGIPPAALFLPVVIIIHGLLMLGLGCLLCTANVYFRDVRLFLDIALLLGFYVTPVFYSASAVPSSYRWMMQLNPMARIIAVNRGLLIDGQLPDALPFLGLAAVCGAICWCGLFVYGKASPSFVDEL
jgi:lipopolysaccharide transport system permease protein